MKVGDRVRLRADLYYEDDPSTPLLLKEGEEGTILHIRLSLGGDGLTTKDIVVEFDTYNQYFGKVLASKGKEAKAGHSWWFYFDEYPHHSMLEVIENPKTIYRTTMDGFSTCEDNWKPGKCFF